MPCREAGSWTEDNPNEALAQTAAAALKLVGGRFILAPVVQETSMPTIDIEQAKSSLSKLVKAIDSGVEQEIIITRDGKPVAKLVPLHAPAAKMTEPAYSEAP
jgi:hypothetical protein